MITRGGQHVGVRTIAEGYPRMRLTWILDDETDARWRHAFAMDGQAWMLIEEYAMVADPA